MKKANFFAGEILNRPMQQLLRLLGVLSDRHIHRVCVGVFHDATHRIRTNRIAVRIGVRWNRSELRRLSES